LLKITINFEPLKSETMKLLRDFQQEAHDTVFQRLEQGVARQLLVFATGLGKTFTATTIIKRFHRVLWITHTEELILQSARSIIADHPEASVGIIKQERFDIDSQIVVASIQTLHRRLDRIDPSTFDCIVVDEAHLAMAETWTKAINHFNFKLLLGLTATPKRLDGISLGNLFDDIVYERGIDFGIKNGYLVELEAIRIKTDISLDKVRTTGGELNSGDLNKTINTPERNRFIVKEWLKYAADMPTLAFAVNIEHATDLTNAFIAQGIAATFVVSDKELCPDREDRIAAFKKGDIKVLVNVMILTAGFDHPPVSCIIAARPTKSETVYLQSIGRGTRPVVNVTLDTVEERLEAISGSSKPKCIIMDIVDSTSRHQLVNTYTLDKDVEIKDKVFMTRAKKQDLLFRIQKKRKLEHERASTEIVSLIALPKIQINNSPAMREPATEKQLKWLKDLGYDIVNTQYTKRDCSEIISNSAAREWQVQRLEKLGYDCTKGVKQGQAAMILKSLEEQEQKKHVLNQSVSVTGIQLPFSGLK
jgi:superfamily II DNA or RNA helicase